MPQWEFRVLAFDFSLIRSKLWRLLLLLFVVPTIHWHGRVWFQLTLLFVLRQGKITYWLLNYWLNKLDHSLCNLEIILATCPYHLRSALVVVI